MIKLTGLWKLKTAAVFCFLIFSSGCVPALFLELDESPHAPLSDDKEAKRFLPVEGMGTIQVFRDRIFRHNEAFPVYVNQQLIGYIGAFIYFSFAVKPGNYSISVAVGDVQYAQPVPRVNFSIGKGELVYFVFKIFPSERVPDHRFEKVSSERGQLGDLNSDRLRH